MTYHTPSQKRQPPFVYTVGAKMGCPCLGTLFVPPTCMAYASGLYEVHFHYHDTSFGDMSGTGVVDARLKALAPFGQETSVDRGSICLAICLCVGDFPSI